MTAIEYLDVGGRPIAYRLRRGNVPTILFLPGYASDMVGAKALALASLAEARDTSILRFDYSGTGSSAGTFADGTLALWLEEALSALDELTEGPVILVGSSMGGWLALHLALFRPQRVRAVIGVAAAPDFTNWGFADGDVAAAQGVARGFWESGQKLLLLDEPISIDCPVRLLHGEVDREVPLDIAFRLMRALHSSDVQLNVLKGGGHRLSEPNEIHAIVSTVEPFLEP